MYANQLLRLPAVSLATGMSVPFIRKEIQRGRLQITRLGRCVCVADQDLNSYLAKRRVAPNTGQQAVSR